MTVKKRNHFNNWLQSQISEIEIYFFALFIVPPNLVFIPTSPDIYIVCAEKAHMTCAGRVHTLHSLRLSALLQLGSGVPVRGVCVA